MRGEDSFVLWTCKRRSVTSKVETQEENKTHKGGNGLWVAVSGCEHQVHASNETPAIGYPGFQIN